jgi:hypothetical protein
MRPGALQMYYLPLVRICTESGEKDRPKKLLLLQPSYYQLNHCQLQEFHIGQLESLADRMIQVPI